MQELAVIAAFALGATLLASGVEKLRDRTGFVLAVMEYRILPTRLSIVYGRALPFAEVLVGLALIAGFVPLAAGAAALALLASFLVGVTVNMARGRELDCHCFGSRSNEPLGWLTVIRILVLGACGSAVIVWSGAALVRTPGATVVPDALAALAIILALYLGRTIVPTIAIWRMKKEFGPTFRRGCVSLAGSPLDVRVETMMREQSELVALNE